MFKITDYECDGCSEVLEEEHIDIFDVRKDEVLEYSFCSYDCLKLYLDENKDEFVK